MQAANGADTVGFTGCGSYTLSIAGLVDNSDGGRPAASASGGGTICLGGSVGLTGTGGTSCVWTPATGLDNANSCTPLASPTVTTAYSVVVKNASGCVSDPSSSVTVTVNSPPATPVVTAPSVVGAGSPNRIASVPAHAGSTWAWGITNGTITGGNGTSQITFTAGTAGTPLTLSVTETNTLGCTSAAGTATVTVLPAGSALRFYTVTPCRALDTRSGSPISSGGTLAVALGGACGIPLGAASVSVNVTAAQVASPGALTIYPADGTQPLASTLNFNAGQNRANNAILRMSSDGTGRVSVYNGSGGTVHVVIDVNGLFQ
jgi:hypothetical protein